MHFQFIASYLRSFRHRNGQCTLRGFERKGFYSPDPFFLFLSYVFSTRPDPHYLTMFIEKKISIYKYI